ncbi:hypothetical protein EI94DRAFT_853069 [Lactarius quietus]|nr:hypothetical protein EI94DRAFT_853069 [Lactarius quietus]
MDCLQPVVKVVHTFAQVFGEVPTNTIFVGIDVLLAAADGVSSSYDALVDLFELTEIVVKIMVELLSVLALATKQIKQGWIVSLRRKAGSL